MWGKPNERIRRCWQAYVKDADSIVGVFLCASIFCELVEIFVAKKNEKYFVRYNSIQEYMADKKEKKQSAVTRKTDKSQTQHQQQLDRLKQQRETRAETRHNPKPAAKIMPMDSFDNYRIKKRGGANRESTEIESHGKNGGETGGKRIRKLNIQDSDESESEAASDYKQGERKGSFSNVRRSTRSTRLTKKSEMAQESSVSFFCRGDC